MVGAVVKPPDKSFCRLKIACPNLPLYLSLCVLYMAPILERGVQQTWQTDLTAQDTSLCTQTIHYPPSGGSLGIYKFDLTMQSIELVVWTRIKVCLHSFCHITKSLVPIFGVFLSTHSTAPWTTMIPRRHFIVLHQPQTQIWQSPMQVHQSWYCLLNFTDQEPSTASISVKEPWLVSH